MQGQGAEGSDVVWLCGRGPPVRNGLYGEGHKCPVRGLVVFEMAWYFQMTFLLRQNEILPCNVTFVVARWKKPTTMQTKNATQKSFYFKVWGLAAKLSPPQSLLLPCFLHFCIQPWKSVSLNSFTRRKQEQVFLSQGGRAVCLHLATDMRG